MEKINAKNQKEKKPGKLTDKEISESPFLEDKQPEILKNNTFEEQFANKLDVNGIEVVKIESDGEDEGKLPAIFAPGWSRTMDTFKNSLKTLHDYDRDVVSLNHRRKAGDIKTNVVTDAFPEEVQRRASSIYEIIKNEIKAGNEELNMVGQSMGGMDALVATLMAEAEKPGTIKNLVLVNPAGMIGKDSVLELGKRFIGQMKQNTDVKKDENRPASAKENVTVAGQEFFKYLKKNPLRAIKEISAMTSMEITGILKELKNRGIGISIIHGVDDLTFPMSMVQENADEEQMDGFYSVKGGHNELYMNPEKYMGLVDYALTAHENKQRISHSDVPNS